MNDDVTPSREQLDELPPSCKFVYDVLDRDGPLTRQVLIDRTGLCARTVDRALDRLQNDDFVHKTRKSNDLREVVAQIGD